MDTRRTFWGQFTYLNLQFASLRIHNIYIVFLPTKSYIPTCFRFYYDKLHVFEVGKQKCVTDRRTHKWADVRIEIRQPFNAGGINALFREAF